MSAICSKPLVLNMSDTECLCYSCRMYDRVRGCQALEDTYFPKYPCPFYKSIYEKHDVPVYTGSVCERCFAHSPDGGCRALTSKPTNGFCRFFKTPEQIAREDEKNRVRLNSYLQRYPELLDKYITLKR